MDEGDGDTATQHDPSECLDAFFREALPVVVDVLHESEAQPDEERVDGGIEATVQMRPVLPEQPEESQPFESLLDNGRTENDRCLWACDCGECAVQHA